MITSADIAYYRERESREREKADRANDISVRIAHLASADGYAARLTDLHTPETACPEPSDSPGDRLATVAAAIDKRIVTACKQM